MPDLIKAIILGIVEGVTEFLPVSSTGHLVLCEWAMRIDLDVPHSFWKLFAIFIQVGAILAVVVYFRHRILDLLLGRCPAATGLTPLEASLSARQSTATLAPRSRERHRALWMIVLATLPIGVIPLIEKRIDRFLGSPMVIVATLAIGGVVMIVIELLPLPATTDRIETMTWKQAVGIGLAQILAGIFPGTSRAAATIMGGMIAGLTRAAATEFSFFLAIPALCAASAYSLLKNYSALDPRELLLLSVGTLVSFLVAWVVIAAFMGYVRRHNFIPFAVYRLLLAAVVAFFAWQARAA